MTHSKMAAHMHFIQSRQGHVCHVELSTYMQSHCMSLKTSDRTTNTHAHTYAHILIHNRRIAV